MARFVASGKTLATAANSNILSMRSTAAQRVRLLEMHLYAETAVAWVSPALFMTTVVDTAGTAVAGQKEDSGSGAPSVVVSTIPTGGTLATVAIRRATLPAVIGSGLIWVWPDSDPLLVPLSLSLMLRNDGVIGPAITWVTVWDE
ncbi:MAG TPA: hypothetical protein VM347_05620 [Nonomuraea sp.]|nr:hypothetical protein [Nonomuraea sp.]